MKTTYQHYGFANRQEYLESLEFDQDAVQTLAELLGPEEDFDGLISMLEDMG